MSPRSTHLREQRHRMAQAVQQAQLSRRGVLSGAAGLAMLGLLSACGTKGMGGAKPSPAADRSAEEALVRWSNWTLYLDLDDDGRTHPTLDAFQKASGLKATHTEDIDSNDTWYGKVQGQLSRGQDIGADIITPSDWMCERLIRQGYVQKLDHANMPNVVANMLPKLKDIRWDQGRYRSVTWQTGFTGIVWNKKTFPQGLRNVSDLWDPRLKGRVTVLDEMRDTMPMLLLDQGIDIAGDWTQTDFENSIDVLDKNIRNGQIRQVKGNSYKEDLISGDVVAAMAYSGDITQLNFENGDQWEFAIPERKGLIWSDNMMVPVGSPHKANAEKLMDFYYDPEVAAEVAAYVNYVCPVLGADEAMKEIDEELVEDPLIFPTEEYLAQTTTERQLTLEEETLFQNLFQEVIGS